MGLDELSNKELIEMHRKVKADIAAHDAMQMAYKIL